MLQWISNLFKSIGTWFLGRSAALDNVDQGVKDAISAEKRKVFFSGVLIGIALVVILMVVF